MPHKPAAKSNHSWWTHKRMMERKQSEATPPTDKKEKDEKHRLE